jgi:hypothetical protein
MSLRHGALPAALFLIFLALTLRVRRGDAATPAAAATATSVAAVVTMYPVRNSPGRQPGSRRRSSHSAAPRPSAAPTAKSCVHIVAAPSAAPAAAHRRAERLPATASSARRQRIMGGHL